MTTSSARKVVAQLNQHDQDHEWYPTTQPMLDVIKGDIDEDLMDNPSVLDCGAGDGRVLKALTNGDKYAIEKSSILIELLDKDIFIVGTEFREQVLFDKKTDLLFCNPPYSEYLEWVNKIIREANCGVIYFIIPTRWKTNTETHDLIKARKGKFEILDTQDFIDGDRGARANVDIVKITLRYTGRHSTSIKKDPFDLWFEDNFKLKLNKESSSKHSVYTSTREKVAENVQHELVTGGDLISTLEKLYQRDMDKALNTYKGLMEVDPEIMRELDIDIKSVKKALKLKIESLKDVYWKELFNNLDKVTSRLTAISREAMLKKLTDNTHVDFTAPNARAIIIWVIKNANSYFDQQLVQIIEKVTEKASIAVYKSNQRTIRDEEWRYSKTPEDLKEYGLDYRIVLKECGGLSGSTLYSDNVNGLGSRAANLMNDFCAIALNLGFDTYETQRASSFKWESNKGHDFEFLNHKTGEKNVLFHAKAFHNGNMHIKFNQLFIRRLNVQFGRLKGWVKSPKEAAEKMDISEEEASEVFAVTMKIESSQILKLGLM